MNRTNIYIGTTLLDLFPDTVVNLNLSLFDVEDFTRRKVFKTGKIEIPLTKNNLDALGYIDDIAAEQVGTLSGYLIQDGLTFSGNVEIYETTNENGRRTAAIQIVQSDWLQSIEGVKLSDLDSSDLYHAKSVLSIDGSIASDLNKNFIYPLIDFGKFKGVNEVLAIDREIAVNIKWLVAQIFAESGYSVNENSYFEINDNWFFLSSEKVEINDNDFIKDRLFRCQNEGESDADTIPAETTNFEIVIWSKTWHTVTFTDYSTGDNFNETTVFDGDMGVFTADKAGAFRFIPSVRVEWIAQALLENVNPLIECRILKNTSSVIVSDTYTGSALSGYNLFELDSSFIHLDEGDTIQVQVKVTDTVTNNSESTQTYTVSISSSSFLYNDVDQRRGLGYVHQDLSDVLPDMEQKEFLQILKNAFNLYFYSNPFTREILITDRDSFYTDYGQDWTDKIDTSKPITIEQPNAPSRILYGYNEDGADFITTAERINDSETILNTVSLTVQDARLSNAGVTYMGQSLRIGIRTRNIPVIWKERNYIEIPDPDFTFKARLLRFDGLQSSSQPWTFEGTSKTSVPIVTPRTAEAIAADYTNLNKCLLESRTVSLTARLTASEINSLIVMQNYEDFRTPILIDIDKIHGYFYLISVSDWNGYTAKVVLQQVKDRNYYQPVSRDDELIENNAFPYYLPLTFS